MRMGGAEEIYRDVPPAQRERLFTFRATHLYDRLTVDDATWRYIACGRGEGDKWHPGDRQHPRTLLLLPGAFLEADMWFNQILDLEEDYYIIAPDAYALQGVFDLEAVCDALVQSLDAEGVESATVIGISAGGGVAQYLLQTHPQRVENVVFSHCGVLEHSADRERQTRRIMWLVRILPIFIIQRLLKRMTTGETPASSRWIAFHEAYMREAIPKIEREMYACFLRSSLETRRRFSFNPDVLESWPGRILILSSKDDALSRQGVEKLQARYPRARTELLEEGGHHAFLFFPEAYSAALRGFLDDVSRKCG